ncbi:MAG: protein translocase subunit SecF [Deltaproteobacteria bacterium]|nr:protein translocase subunit SecF [Deltaproteobacteria bacterium]
MKLQPEGLRIDFVGKRKITAIISAVLVSACLAFFFLIGPNWGIDFTGGTEVHLKFEAPVPIDDVRNALAPIGLTGSAIQQVSGPDSGEYSIRIQDPEFGTENLVPDVQGRLEAIFGQGWIQEIRKEVEVGVRLTFVHTGPDMELGTIQAALDPLGGLQVEKAPDDKTYYVKVPSLNEKIRDRIAQYLEEHPFEVRSVDSVGPKVGSELRRQSAIAVTATLFLMLLYIGFRFDVAYAPGAILALFHDISIILGFYVISQREFDVGSIGVLLTILGYSINDTIVIYDRIREHQREYRRQALPDLLNDSINETLGRTIATSVSTFLAMIPFLFWGTGTIKTFAMAMLVGIVTGSYSTIFIASPVILLMQDVKPFLARFLKPSRRGSPEQAAGVSQEHRRLGRLRDAPAPEKGKPESEHDLFRRS